MGASIYADNIVSLAEGSAPIGDDDGPRLIDERFDELADAHAPWSWEKRANLALMRALKPTKSVAVVGTVRNEGINLIEWIAHCRAVGFERIFLYTNDNTDGSDAILHALHRHGAIQLLINRFATSQGPQLKAYEHSVHLLRELRDYEWVAYLDADEFLIPADHFDNSVRNMVRAVRGEYAHQMPMAIALNWMWVGSENLVERRGGLIQETFLTASPHDHVKSIVRLQDITTMWPIHIPDPGKHWMLNGSFQQVVMSDVTTPHTYTHGKINHYYHKSFEEFVAKILRNKGAGVHFANKGFSDFFTWDVMNSTHGRYATPAPLLARVKAEIATLMALDGVADAVMAVESGYAALLRAELGEDLGALYERASAAAFGPR